MGPRYPKLHFELHSSQIVWVRNRAGENRPGDIRPNHFVYTCVGTRVSTHVSTRVGAFVGTTTQRNPTFVGTLVYTCVSTRVSTCGSPFVGALVGHISLLPALCFTDISTKLIPKTIFHVTEMRFSKRIAPKQLFHVVLRIANEHVI